jgi:hypothetical protein
VANLPCMCRGPCRVPQRRVGPKIG